MFIKVAPHKGRRFGTIKVIMISVFQKSKFKVFGGILALSLTASIAWGQTYKSWNISPSSGNMSSANWLVGQTPGTGTATLAAGDWPTFGASTITSLTTDLSM